MLIAASRKKMARVEPFYAMNRENVALLIRGYCARSPRRDPRNGASRGIGGGKRPPLSREKLSERTQFPERLIFSNFLD